MGRLRATIRRRRALVAVYARRLRAQPLSATLRRLLRPGVARTHVLRLLGVGPEKPSNQYLASHSRAQELAFCAALVPDSDVSIEGAYDELEADGLGADLGLRYREVRPDAPSFELGRFRMWYALVRVLRPAVVLETGVHDGLSSAVILAALERNGRGRLVSVDLPSTDLPPTVDGAGWLVPERLRSRWTLLVGDARRLLPDTARALAPIDVFSHDSDHSAEHQAFEYETVEPHLAPGALVLSDQDYPLDPALERFAGRVHGVHRRVRTVAGEPGLYAGGVRLRLK